VAFFVARVVGVFGFDADFVSFVFGGQGVGFAVRVSNWLPVALPLVVDFGFVKLVGVVHLRGQGFAYFGVAADGDVAFVVRLRLWRLRVRIGGVNDWRGGSAGRCFAVVGVVGVSRLDGDLRPFLCFGQGEGAVGRTRNFFAVGQPCSLFLIVYNPVPLGSGGVCVVEWAQYIEDELPSTFLKVQIDRVGDDESKRVIRLVPQGKEYEEFINKLEATDE